MILIDLTLMGFVTMKVWNWFLPALNAGVPEIAFSQAVGLRMVWLCFNRSAPDKENGPESDEKQNTAYLIKMVAYLFLSPLFILGMAFAVKSILF